MTRTLISVMALLLSAVSASHHVELNMRRIIPPYTGYRCLQDGGIVRFVDFKKMCVTTHHVPRRK
ncbi:hypothetical protein Q0M94_25065 (plasmid) [Deinococcus radiomollis]|uniref:hypothetical protein n=1 Tax=Deinococcus radiomollis TaxID=468916 RepID=UPI003891973E